MGDPAGLTTRARLKARPDRRAANSREWTRHVKPKFWDWLKPRQQHLRCGTMLTLFNFRRYNSTMIPGVSDWHSR